MCANESSIGRRHAPSLDISRTFALSGWLNPKQKGKRGRLRTANRNIPGCMRLHVKKLSVFLRLLCVLEVGSSRGKSKGAFRAG